MIASLSMVDKVGLIEQQLGACKPVSPKQHKCPVFWIAFLGSGPLSILSTTLSISKRTSSHSNNNEGPSGKIKHSTSRNTQRGCVTSCVPSWLCPYTQVSAQSGKGFAPPSKETSDNFAIDVWRRICESNHLSSFVYICQCGLRWQERSLGSSEWVFWCIYRPKNTSKDVKHGKNASKQLWVRRGFAEATTRRGTRFHEHHVGILVAWLSLLLLKCYGINGLA